MSGQDFYSVTGVYKFYGQQAQNQHNNCASGNCAHMHEHQDPNIPSPNDPTLKLLANNDIQKLADPAGQGMMRGGSPKGMMQGAPQGMMRGAGQGMMQGAGQGMMRGAPQGMMQGAGQCGSPQGMMQGAPQGMMHSTPQPISRGKMQGAPKAAGRGKMQGPPQCTSGGCEGFNRGGNLSGPQLFGNARPVQEKSSLTKCYLPGQPGCPK